MKKTESAGGIVLNIIHKEIAIVTNGQGNWWGFPKGHIDPGEDALTAAIREIAEETSITELSLVKELGSYERFRGSLGGSDDTRELKTIYMFLFTTTQEAIASQDSFNPEARWASADEVAAMLNHPKDREFFARVRGELAAIGVA